MFFSNVKTTKAVTIILIAAVIVMAVIVIFMGQRLSRAEQYISENGKLLLVLHDNSEKLTNVSKEHNDSIERILLILESAGLGNQ